MKNLSRRTFLKSAAAAGTAASLALPLDAEAPLPYPENGTLLPDHGWHLQLDPDAPWAADEIFLPEDVAWVNGVLCGEGKPLAVHAPTLGWAALTPEASTEVMLPTTVEQHFWGAAIAGRPGPRPYTPDEYRYAATAPPVAPADDAVPLNGAYYGVSWWHRAIEIPAAMRGKRIFLRVRGARLRAEVYLNRKLVGYSIMEELPFECDLTHAADPGGLNVIAIRLTNPFGRFDWVDGLNAAWGQVALHRSHGFAGLDRGMTIAAHGGASYIRDLWVLNKPDAKSVSVFCEVATVDGRRGGGASIRIDVIDPTTGKVVATNEKPGMANVGGFADTDAAVFHEDMRFDGAQLWTLASPKIYHLRASLRGDSDQRTVPFGFRWFAPEGVSTDALFRLNGKRIRIYSSISWGFWGLNGLFPVPELAEKEVRQAKALGLNCLNFHRNLPKEDVLRAHDRLGVLRYMEPGGGKLAVGKLPDGAKANSADIVMAKPTSTADKFAQRYMIAKCVGMVRASRSHPSVIEYCLQNEIGADLNNPDTLAVLAAMRAEDPSRCIVLNDGFVAPPRKAAQAWYEPWNEKLHRSDSEEWGGWWNQHQGAGDQWYDEFYKSPTDYTYRSPEHKALSEFGEMEGCARPDNHALMLHQITETYKKYGPSGIKGASYDLFDHQEILNAYDRFLDKWTFRGAFPSVEKLFNALGKICYETWQNYLENARISDDLDFAVISGWESTAIENHSGIVDNLRNFKSDPAPIAQTLRPVHPLAKQRSLCVKRGESTTFDLFLLNDTGKAATGTLTFSMVTPSGRKTVLTTLAAPPQTPDQFSYLLQEGFVTPALTEEGLYRFQFAIASAPLATHTKELWVTGVANTEQLIPRSIAVLGLSPAVRKQMQQAAAACGFVLVPFKKGGTFAGIVAGGLQPHAVADDGKTIGETTGLEAAPPAGVAAAPAKPTHTPEPGEEVASTQAGRLPAAVLDAVRAGTPLFAIPQSNALSDGVAKQLADAGAFTFGGNVGDFRAPWMGNWYFVREHALFSGLPVNQALGGFYQVRGRQSNGLLVDGPEVEVVVAYSRDHDRKLGAGTFTTKLGGGKVLYHRTPEFQPVLQARFLANALRWLTS